MSSSLIINVTEANFEYEVIEYSHNTPVLVDFWAEWCVPCKTLEPILEELTRQAGGDFRLARLNVDENQNLALRYNVRGIPAIKAFRDGIIVGEFTGLKPKLEIRKFLRHVVPSSADLQLDRGQNLLRLNDWQQATQAFYHVLEDIPDHPSALLGLAKSLLVQGKIKEAHEILKDFPPSQEYTNAQQLIPLAEALSQLEENAGKQVESIEATYRRALRLTTRGNLPAAMDGLLAVLRQDKNYREGEARKALLGLFNILGENNPTTRQYRDELASILY